VKRCADNDQQREGDQRRAKLTDDDARLQQRDMQMKPQ